MDLLQVHNRVVSLDHGQFCLVGEPGRSGDYIRYLEEASGGRGIAGDDYAVIICPPHQNNLEMPLRVELWNGVPPDDNADWDEVFRCGLVVGSGGFYYLSTDAQEVVFEIPANSYSVIICGRGFVNRGWPGSTTPGDVWRIQMWPSGDRPKPERIKMWR